MRCYIKTLIVVIIFFFSSNKIIAQSLPEITVKKIDSLFERWNNTNGPGCSVGIVRNDSLIFSRGYGLSNLEYNIPITPETIFYMASVSKQFTGYCISLLARQGKIKLDEDIHVYLPWVPEFGKKITVRNLLNHTSGIRDDIFLAAISGLGDDGMLTQDLALNILQRQRSLNFDPGEQYSYSNSNFVLLTEIVKVVSGKSFRNFADSAIFKPLGMTNTRFQDNYVELIKNRAFSYQRLDSNHYANDFQNVYTLGDGGLFSNILDMAKWITNFYNTKAGDANDINQLTEKGRLNNKKELNYALGIVVDNYKGKKVFSHGGGLSGYRTFTCVFPDIKMGFIIFGNVGDFPAGSKAYQIADLFIKDTTQKTLKHKTDSSTAILKDTLSIQKFLGNYISENGLQARFNINEGKLYSHIDGRTFLLVEGKKDTFSVFDMPNLSMIFNVKGKDTNVVAILPNRTHHFKKFVNDTSQSDQFMKAYVGTYYCPELDSRYSIILKDHHLFLTSNKYNNTRLTLAGADHLINDLWCMDHLLVLRNNKKQITGFEVNTGRLNHLRFDKIE